MSEVCKKETVLYLLHAVLLLWPLINIYLINWLWNAVLQNVAGNMKRI